MKKGDAIKIGGAAAIALIAGFYIGAFTNTDKAIDLSSYERQTSHEYSFINPLLSCGEDQFSMLPNNRAQELESKMKKLLDDKKDARVITDGAVYFRQLNGGFGLGVNSDAMFTPGSLLKVPLALSIYRRAEKEPGFLAQQIAYEGGEAPEVEHYRSDTITKGTTYSIEDLVKASLIHSDNNATLLLSQLISQEELLDSYEDLGITKPTFGQDYQMSVKVYASFFRFLYNATYIDHDASEHLLSLLAQSAFKVGLVGGVPEGTVVAHKFGERKIEGEATEQLHDCGIVYHPKQPYLICVMLRGNDIDQLAATIREVSAVAYEYAE